MTTGPAKTTQQEQWVLTFGGSQIVIEDAKGFENLHLVLVSGASDIGVPVQNPLCVLKVSAYPGVVGEMKSARELIAFLQHEYSGVIRVADFNSTAFRLDAIDKVLAAFHAAEGDKT